jgi:hypothetical protein
VFVVAVAEKPAGQFMMRNRTRVVKPASGRRTVRAKLQSGHGPYRDTTPSTRDSGNIDSMGDSAILRAEQYVAEPHRIVASQRIIVEQLYAAGCDTLDAEQTLRVFEKSLRTFEGHRDWLRKHGADK